MFVRKLESRGGDGCTKPEFDDNTTLTYLVFEYAPTSGFAELALKLVLPYLRHLANLQNALLSAGGGMTVGERATFVVTLDSEKEQACAEAASCLILDLDLHGINHTLRDYNPDTHAYLPYFGDAVSQMQIKGWPTIERIFQDVKAVFAEYNKWDDYGIALPFKDVDLRADERLIEFNGTLMPWCGILANTLEKYLVPRSIRIWEGRKMPYSFRMQYDQTMASYDIDFEKEALSRLGGLALVRLGSVTSSETEMIQEVESMQNGCVVTYPAAACEPLWLSEDLVPIMWRFQRRREAASERHKILPIRFRARNRDNTAASSISDYASYLSPQIDDMLTCNSARPPALFAVTSTTDSML